MILGRILVLAFLVLPACKKKPDILSMAKVDGPVDFLKLRDQTLSDLVTNPGLAGESSTFLFGFVSVANQSDATLAMILKDPLYLSLVQQMQAGIFSDAFPGSVENPRAAALVTFSQAYDYRLAAANPPKYPKSLADLFAVSDNSENLDPSDQAEIERRYFWTMATTAAYNDGLNSLQEITQPKSSLALANSSFGIFSAFHFVGATWSTASLAWTLHSDVRGMLKLFQEVEAKLSALDQRTYGGYQWLDKSIEGLRASLGPELTARLENQRGAIGKLVDFVTSPISRSPSSEPSTPREFAKVHLDKVGMGFARMEDVIAIVESKATASTVDSMLKNLGAEATDLRLVLTKLEIIAGTPINTLHDGLKYLADKAGNPANLHGKLDPAWLKPGTLDLAKGGLQHLQTLILEASDVIGNNPRQFQEAMRGIGDVEFFTKLEAFFQAKATGPAALQAERLKEVFSALSKVDAIFLDKLWPILQRVVEIPIADEKMIEALNKRFPGANFTAIELKQWVSLAGNAVKANASLAHETAKFLARVSSQELTGLLTESDKAIKQKKLDALLDDVLERMIDDETREARAIASRIIEGNFDGLTKALNGEINAKTREAVEKMLQQVFPKGDLSIQQLQAVHRQYLDYVGKPVEAPGGTLKNLMSARFPPKTIMLAAAATVSVATILRTLMRARLAANDSIMVSVLGRLEQRLSRLNF